jgi:hypothetical protein
MVRQISQIVINNQPNLPDEKINWTDMTRLHDQMRDIASEGTKNREKYMKMLQKAYLDKQVEENKLKKVKQIEEKDKDEWNTIEQMGYNDEVLKRYAPSQNSIRGDNSNSVVAPDWNDTSLKYLKQSVNDFKNSYEDDKNKQTKKHFLYPLLNNSKRSHFKKIMESYCKNFNECQTRIKESKDNIKDFERKYNKKLIKLIKNNTSESSDNLKLPGTISGDDRLHRQMTKYLENDMKIKSFYKNNTSLEDPFKVRDKKFMKFKYHHQLSRNDSNTEKIIKTATDKITDLGYQSLVKDKNVGEYKEILKNRINEQLTTYNPFMSKEEGNSMINEYKTK